MNNSINTGYCEAEIEYPEVVSASDYLKKLEVSERGHNTRRDLMWTIEVNPDGISSDENVRVSTEEEVDIEEIYGKLIDCGNADNAKDTAIIEKAKERLKKPETVEMLKGWKEYLGVENIVVVEENGEARFVDVSQNLNVQKQAGRYSTLVKGDAGAKMRDEYIQYELVEADKLPDDKKLTDEEKPKFIEWITNLLSSSESEISGPDSVEARFLAFAHGRARLISHASYDGIAQANRAVYENITMTWYDKSLVEVFRAKFAPCGGRYHGGAYRDGGGADYRNDLLGARLAC